MAKASGARAFAEAQASDLAALARLLGRGGLKVVVPSVAVAVAAAAAVVLAALFLLAQEQSIRAAAAARGTIEAALHRFERQLAGVADDEARRFAAAGPPAADALSSLHRELGIAYCLLFDETGRPVGSQTAGAPDLATILAALGPPPDGQSVQTGYVRTVAGPALAAAVPLELAQRTSRASGQAARLVLVAPLAGRPLADLTALAHLPDLDLGPPVAAPGLQSVALRGADGTVAGTLSWRQPRPGDAIVHRVLPLLLTAVGGVGFLGWRSWRRGRGVERALAASEARAQLLELVDPLTRLPNRIFFAGWLAQALSRAEAQGSGVALLHLDLDGFKEINETMGHAAGDRLLCLAAARIRAGLKAGEVAARLGDDEFAVAREGVVLPQFAQEIGRRLLRLLAEPFEIDGRIVQVCTSVGIAVAPGDGSGAVQLSRHAGMALLLAKQTRGGAVRHFEPAMGERLASRRRLIGELRQAMPAGQLEVHYQPQCALHDRRLLGFEALLRWRHPERGLIGPAEFVPLAEETGLIHEIGAWVLRTACAEAVRWPGLKMAVNLSPAQFHQHGLATLVAGILAETGLPAQQLELEITESSLLGNSRQVCATLERLRALGTSIALDDFGTGYSSLGQLHRVPVDVIKIDRSFIAQLGRSARAEAILRAVMGLAEGLGVTVIAEGIETEAQLIRLRAFGCAQGQGYYYARPLPPAQLAKAGWREPQAVRPLEA
ncbi:putative bifunctional diguanylate cyclase/phosphodiesterase [Marinimicrococcus flavescens]|uniref:Bifunctional diguanylate cyclase/phosphodiesterase n=1 Tax=Marinimicrococcus flavescens TaxID=3031815 RepID=A0AAP3V133_9PROT|nr:bifunctional diguanylate cyclase/phosphodiesterase [Marinimicrococcus flavescens]